MTTKPTPGDWTIGPQLSSGRFGGPTIKSSENRTVAVVFSGGGHQDERILTAAANSYRRHFADPVAAAESDLLGQALDIASALLAGLQQFDAETNCAIIRPAASLLDYARAVLSQTKEPT